MVLIGTNDSSPTSAGPGGCDHPKVREAYERTIAACRLQGKHCGIGS